MIKSLVFDKDGVLLDLIETWLPVMQGLAEYTVSYTHLTLPTKA